MIERICKNCKCWANNHIEHHPSCPEEIDIGIGKDIEIMAPAEYKVWLKQFMPELFLPSFNLAPGEVLDRTDGKLVHLDGLNLSRAWCLNSIGTSINNPALRKLAIKHLDAALPQVASGSYAGEHWLASFSVYALTY